MVDVALHPVATPVAKSPGRTIAPVGGTPQINTTDTVTLSSRIHCST
jgi:hypothetical protein